MLQMDERGQNAPSAVLAEYLTDRELAAELNVSVRTLARWRRLRVGPALTKVGRKVAYRRAAINAWLAANETSV